VKKQFLQQVKPMHDQFVESSARQAKTVISGEIPLDEALRAMLTALT
jgi:hypothetical protein